MFTIPSLPQEKKDKTSFPTSHSQKMKSTTLRMPCSSFSMTLLVTLLVLGTSLNEVIAKHKKYEPKVLPSPQEQVCERKTMPVTITSAGCEPREYNVHYCTGSCQSSATVHVPKGTSSPTITEQCHCCRGIDYKVKLRRLAFTCDGVQTNRTVYLPIITKCECNICS